MDKPEYEYYRVTELSKRWDLTINDLLEYCRQGKLEILINWTHLRRTDHNTACAIDKGWVHVPLHYDFPQLHLKSFCEECKYRNSDNCNFAYEEEYLQSLDEYQLEQLGEVKITKDDLWISKAEINRYEEKNTKRPLSPYLQPAHKYYSKELEAMTRAWHAVFIEKDNLNEKSSTQTVKDYISENYSKEEWSSDKINNMGSIVASCYRKNWSDFIKEHQK